MWWLSAERADFDPKWGHQTPSWKAEACNFVDACSQSCQAEVDLRFRSCSSLCVVVGGSPINDGSRKANNASWIWILLVALFVAVIHTCLNGGYSNSRQTFEWRWYVCCLWALHGQARMNMLLDFYSQSARRREGWSRLSGEGFLGFRNFYHDVALRGPFLFDNKRRIPE